MVREEAAIGSIWGMHARLAFHLSRLAGGFTSRITVHYGAASADGREIMELMMLGACPDDLLMVEAEGPDEREAVTAITNFLRNDARLL